jgi:Mrp family chromosome partitioning ATPase
MSRIFDGLQKSQAERHGIEARNLSAAELLELAEHARAAERESASERLGGPVNTRTDLSSLRQPELHPLPLEDEGAKPTPHTLKIDDTQRDQLTNFIQHVFLMPKAEAPRTVVLAGTESGNGCSWIACRVADILASHVKARICIVDANLRSPVLHQMFRVDNHYGLSDALEATEPIPSFVRPLGRRNLWLLSCGATATHHSLLSLDRMRLRLTELRQYFTYVLLDSPALSVGCDAVVLGRAADGVVLVLKANSTRREAARKAVLNLQSAGVRILGAVLNRRTFPIPQAIYGRL